MFSTRLPPKWKMNVKGSLTSCWKTWMGENMNRGIVRNCHTCNYFGLHTNVKFKAIFKINIFNFLIVDIFIKFNGNHHKIFGSILKRLWTSIMDFWNDNTTFVTQRKWKLWTQKICQSSVINEEFISEVYWNKFPNIYILKF
jgi:hypothetical protein